MRNTNKGLHTFDDLDIFDVEKFNNENMCTINDLLIVDKVVDELPTASSAYANKVYVRRNYGIAYKCEYDSMTSKYRWCKLATEYDLPHIIDYNAGSTTIYANRVHNGVMLNKATATAPVLTSGYSYETYD